MSAPPFPGNCRIKSVPEGLPFMKMGLAEVPAAQLFIFDRLLTTELVLAAAD